MRFYSCRDVEVWKGMENFFNYVRVFNFLKVVSGGGMVEYRFILYFLYGNGSSMFWMMGGFCWVGVVCEFFYFIYFLCKNFCVCIRCDFLWGRRFDDSYFVCFIVF